MYLYVLQLDALFNGDREEKWDIQMLAEACRVEHGFTSESRAIRWLLEIVSEFNPEEQRAFLRFVTGSPRLPIGGTICTVSSILYTS